MADWFPRRKPAPSRTRSICDAAQLEARIMLSAAPLPTGAGEVAATPAAFPAPDQVAAADPALWNNAAPPIDSEEFRFQERSQGADEQAARLELVFVDTEADNYQQLIDDLLEDASDHVEREVYLLDNQRDGVTQIREILAGYQEVDAVHLVTHGSAGQFHLGSTRLSVDSLAGYAGDLAAWQGALRDGADLLIYGCDLASTEDGRSLAAAIGALCDCDVAASDDLTGHADLGGDWDLEFRQGEVHTEIAFSATLQQTWRSTLADAQGELVFTTKGDGDAGGTTWSKTDIVTFGDAGDTFDSEAGLTSGTLALFPGFTAPEIVRGLHYVESNITIGANPNHFDLRSGDLVLAFDKIVTLNENDGDPGNDFDADRKDLVVYRPDAPGDYSAGEYFMLLDDQVRDASNTFNVYALTLVETDTVVGGTTLTAGTFLVAHSNPNHEDISTLHITGTGVNSAADVVEVLLTGAVLGNTGDQIQGLHLLQQDTQFGSSTLAAGTLLVQVNRAGVLAGQAQEEFDVLALQVTQTEQDPAPGTAATATLLLDGSDIGLEDEGKETITGLAVVSSDFPGVNKPPVAAADSYTIEGDTSLHTAPDWFDAAWQARQKLSLKNLASAENLVDFPVLVTLDASRIDYDQVQDAGQDLRFVDADGTELAYEIEEWNEGGTSYVWVRIPQIDAASDTDYLWMYYSNAAAADNQNPSGVWSSSYALVSHLDGDLKDATANGNDGVNNGSTDASGQIAGGQSFDGSNDRVDIAADPSINNLFDGGATVSAWINPADWGELGEGRILDKSVTTLTTSGWSLEVDSTGNRLAFEFGFSITNGRWYTPLDSISLDAWQQVTVVYDSSSTANDPQIFINGASVGLTQILFPLGGAISDAANDLAIGNRSGATDRTFDGVIDEVRLETIERSADWIEAQYLSMADAFLDYGAVEGPGGVLTNDADIENEAFTAILVGSAPANAQSFAFNSDGSFSYTPVADFTGIDTFTYKANDGSGDGNTTTVTIQVNPVNDTPQITSLGGGATGAISVNENELDVVTVTAFDIDGDTPLYAIRGGADAARFAIDSSTGQLSFVTAPDFESPTDGDANNVYDVEVEVSDGSGSSDSQTIQVTVLAVNESSPVFTSPANVNVAENTTFVQTVQATDADLPSKAVTYAITGGPDQSLFTINAATGDLSFVTAPDFESPQDVNRDNVYQIVLKADDGASGSITQLLRITVLPANEHNPAFTSPSTVSVAENTTFVQTVQATDADLPGQTITYAITGGADQARFTINATTGALSFVTAPDFETPTDANADNVYQVVVSASDNAGGVTPQTLSVTVLPVNDNSPVFSSPATVNVAENTTFVLTVQATDADLPAQTITYAITGGADQARFTINATTGALSFAMAPDFEAPTDANADNVYQVEVSASDNAGGVTPQTLSVTVLPVNDNSPVFSSPATVNVAENTTFVQTVQATDADLPGQTITYAITGGADQARFTINAATGALSFVTAPDFESPSDANVDNVYEVAVTADDGNGRTTVQNLRATVLQVNESPVITSSAIMLAMENSTAAGTSTASDVDGDPLIWSITGGADASLLTIDAVTGDLAFKNAPNFENPLDGGRDNVYEVQVRVADGLGGADTQLVRVAVSNVNEAPVSRDSSYTVGQGQTLAAVVQGQDEDGDALLVSLATGPANGVLSLLPDGTFQYRPGPDFTGLDSFVYQIVDGVGGTTTSTVTVVVNSPDSVIPVGPAPPPAPPAAVAPPSPPEEVVEDSSQEPQLANPEIHTPDASLVVAQVLRSREADEPTTASAAELPAIAELRQSGPENYVATTATEAVRQLERALQATAQDVSPTLLSLGESFDAGLLWEDLGELRQELQGDDQIPLLAAGSAAGVSGALSVGYVIWTIRSGWLMTSLLAQLPAWRLMDPLVMLEYLDEEAPLAGGEDDDSLESLLEPDEPESETEPESPHPQADDPSDRPEKASE
ncbi:DUF2341 domain-containing protein [Lignipirellula cremea]|uniref:Cadherin domain protein n=1 Tax=Lignipirellula cremea TaxID=2528010 RepID=A0A518E4J7_9BACT|nr:DUF2341 domain-containing protein [Lignipirellula cremea]QDU99016.1 Cadherin domain protein [Lignipirellula cremea]